METMQLVAEAMISPVTKYQERLDRIKNNDTRNAQYALTIKAKEFFSGVELTDTEKLLCVDNKIQRGALMASTAVLLESIEKNKNAVSVVEDLHQEVKELGVEANQ